MSPDTYQVIMSKKLFVWRCLKVCWLSVNHRLQKKILNFKPYVLMRTTRRYRLKMSPSALSHLLCQCIGSIIYRACLGKSSHFHVLKQVHRSPFMGLCCLLLDVLTQLCKKALQLYLGKLSEYSKKMACF